MARISVIIILVILFVLAFFYFVPELKNESFKGISQTSTQTANSENFSTWEEFLPRSGLFKVLLPQKPQYAKDLVAIPGSDKKRRYDMYASEKIDGTLFLITVITYPTEAEASSSDDLLRETVDELMRSKSDNRLTKLENGFFQKQNSLNFSIENQKFHVEGKVFIAGKRVFSLSYITLKDNFDSAEYQHFIDSFKLLTIGSK